MPDAELGQVVAAYGRAYLVSPLSAPNQTLLCYPRGKKSEVVCGDIVDYLVQDATQGVIVGIQPRRQLLWRSNAFRKKLIAANVDLAIIVVATTPSFSESLITRCLLACEQTRINGLILLNKVDLQPYLPAAHAALQVFENLGYPIIEFSVNHDLAVLAEHLTGATSILIGQSGMGKSTIINRLLPDVAARTQSISRALNSGKHTTTASCLYRLPSAYTSSAGIPAAIIDSPGLQAFGINQLSADELEQGFREFRPWLGQCKFRDCTHERQILATHCAIRAAVERGQIKESRYTDYLDLAAAKRLADNPY